MGFFSKAFLWLVRSRIGQAIGTLVVERVLWQIKDAVARSRERKRKLAEMRAELEILQKAKTKEEIDNAINDVLDDI